MALTNKQKEKIIEMSASGRTVQEISEATGIARSTVHDTIKRNEPGEDNAEDYGDDYADDYLSELNEESSAPAPDPALEPDQEPDASEEVYHPDGSEPEAEQPSTPEPSPESVDIEAMTNEIAATIEEEYRKIFRALSETNRDLMQSSMQKIDKAYRMVRDTGEILTATEYRMRTMCDKYTALTASNGSAAPVQPANWSLHIIIGTMALVMSWLFGAVCSLCNWELAAGYTVAALYAAAAVTGILYWVGRMRSGTVAWMTLGVLALPISMFAGYVFFLLGPISTAYWLKMFFGIPAGLLIAFFILLLIRKSAKGKTSDNAEKTEQKEPGK